MVLAKYLKRGEDGEGLVHPGYNGLFDRFLEELWAPTLAGQAASRAGWLPVVDVEETEADYLIRAEVPGMKREDIKVSLEDNVLTLTGEKKQEVRSEQRKLHRLESSYGAFQRSFNLPAAVAPDKVSASFKEGVLTVTLPKSEQARPKQIDIKVG